MLSFPNEYKFLHMRTTMCMASIVAVHVYQSIVLTSVDPKAPHWMISSMVLETGVGINPLRTRPHQNVV